MTSRVKSRDVTNHMKPKSRSPSSKISMADRICNRLSKTADRDPSAALALAFFGDSRGEAPTLKMLWQRPLPDQILAVLAIKALAKQNGTTDSIRANLFHLIIDDAVHQVVSTEAAMVFGALRDETLALRLVKVIEGIHPRPPPVANEVAEALSTIIRPQIRDFFDDDGVPALKRRTEDEIRPLLAHPDVRVRERAVRSLQNGFSDLKTRYSLEALSKWPGEVPSTRADALAAIDRYDQFFRRGSKSAVSPLPPTVEDPISALRSESGGDQVVRAAKAICENESRDALPLIREHLSKGDINLWGAMFILSTLGEHRDLHLLIDVARPSFNQRFEDRYEWISRNYKMGSPQSIMIALSHALSHLGKESDWNLANTLYLTEKCPWVRAAMAGAMATIAKRSELPI